MSLLLLLAVTMPARSNTADTLTVDSVPPPDYGVTLRHTIDSIIASSSLLETSQLGLMIYDLDADSTLYSYNHRQTMRPASIMKVITAVTALDRLGGSYQFKTHLRYGGEICDSTHTLHGNVYIVGGMDPRIGRDDLTAFAESLRKLGIDTIRGNVCVDNSMKQRDLLGEGWCWDDDNPVLSATVYGRKDQMKERFADILSDCGIYHYGERLEQTAPSSSKDVCSRSHSIDQILMRMMKESDNLYAESMFYNLACSQGRPATASGGRTVVQSLMRRMKLDPSRYRIADGSGLSLYNYVTAELEVQFLRYAFRNVNIYNHLYPSLPVAGVDGTLSKRMTKTCAAGNVHAKTGTLTGVSSLAGYATAPNGHRLAFCIINQGVMHATNAKSFQDKICIAMCQ